LLVAVLLAALTADQAVPAPAPVLSESSQPRVEGPFTLDAAFAAAEANNPTLAAARLGRAADLAGIDVARRRPNPEASFEAGRDTPHEAFSIGVPLEFGGKRARRVDLANATLARTTAEIVVRSLEIRREVRLAYFELVAASARVQVTTDLRGFAERARNAARDRFQSGAAPRLESVQAELALAQADNEQEAARGRLEAARVELNTLLGAPPGTPATPSDPFEVGAIPADVTAIIVGSPVIVAIDREIDEALARERLARTLRTPDTTVSGGVLFDSPPEFTYGWKAGVAVTIPVFTRHEADVRVETARVAQLRAERVARVTELTGQAIAAAARAQAARRRFLRYRDEIMPQLSTMESMAEDSYRSGQTGLAAFLQALQAAREVRLLATDAGLEYQQALADLERALGGPIR
jgi:cobalt-zinc-cadmium efflux system outer membrane protein